MVLGELACAIQEGYKRAQLKSFKHKSDSVTKEQLQEILVTMSDSESLFDG